MNSQVGTVAGKISLPAVKTKKKSTKTSTKKQTSSISKRSLLKIGLALFTIAVLIGSGFLFQRTYADKIYPKIMIAGINVGGMTREQAETVLSEKIKHLNNNGPEITYNDQTLKPTLDEMGITFNTDEILDQAFGYGRNGSFQDKVKDDFSLAFEGTTLEISPQIDQAIFDEYLSQLASVVEKEPINAQITISDGVISITEEENGRGLDKNKLKTDLTNLINSGQTSGKIVMATSDLMPDITIEGTTDAKVQAERMLSAAPIVVTFENIGWTASRNEIGSWIKFSQNGNNLVASVHPDGFIAYIAEQVEIPAHDREIEDGTGNVLEEGSDGRGVDTDTLTAQIRESVALGQPSTFALVTFAIARGEKTIYPHAQPGRFAGRYIDINLSEQTLYAFEGGTLVNQFLVSTGKSGYSTPTGEFSVYGKDRAALMDGPDYYLPGVPYISWFSGDYSIHGTYWHSNFGHTMSHGCVNMATEDAEWIYNWDEIGTPVYIHY